MNRGFISVISKTFLTITFFVFLSIFYSQAAQAYQSSSPQYNLNTNPDVPQNLNTYTQSVFIEILSTASCFLTGANPISPETKCLGIDTKTGKLGIANEKPGGLLTLMVGMVGDTYSIPVSSVDYVNHLASNFGFSKRIYAQSLGTGIGFIGLTPVLGIWTTFRNLAYLVFVFIFILLGLGIMFRVNIDARTVMTIQNQIPKIIIGLILITFSYAIAGFLIDMMYVSIYLIIHLFPQATPLDINSNPMAMAGGLGGFFSIGWNPAMSFAHAIASIFNGPITNFISTIIGGILGAIVGSSVPIVGTFIGALGGAAAGRFVGNEIIGFIAGLIAYLIIVVAIFTALFRTWIMLIKAYIFILLGVVFAPFWIMIGILPIGTGGVGPWLRSLIANLAAFPVVVIIFVIGKKMVDTLSTSTPAQGNFIPPLVGDIGNGSASGIASLIGLGLILILPEALNITKSTLKAPDFKLTAAVGAAIGTGRALVSSPIKGAREELFGKTPLGDPRAGSVWLGRRVGRIGTLISGGGLHNSTTDESGNRVQIASKWFTIPKFRLRKSPVASTRSTDTPDTSSGGDSTSGQGGSTTT